MRRSSGNWNDQQLRTVAVLLDGNDDDDGRILDTFLAAARRLPVPKIGVR
jgi:hypothetical protein